ncbi:MAG: MBOAT family protein [Tissierellia bacterium]|nr:MBOAT family protein [Tissierellia bacterium]
MLFSSLGFLYYFLPLVLVLYFLAPDRLKNKVLLLASLIFYGWGEPRLILLMLISILVHYLLGIRIEEDEENSKLWLILSIVFQLGLLGYYKYSNFFIDNVNHIFKTSLPLLKVSLPLGISFYSFQIMSYTIDVYRKETRAQRSYTDLATYISLFPQLVAGPIVRYSQIAESLKYRQHSLERLWLGFRRFILGLAKKVLLANLLGEIGLAYSSASANSLVFTWLYAISYTLQIYFDFSGYSDMALGLGQIFGFDFLENFNYPLSAKSIQDFWSRWHISLSTWFRDYLYIPLGGNRVSKKRWIFNFFTVWFLTGLWHGADWNFIFWGLFFAVFLILEKLYLSVPLERLPSPVRRIYTLFIVMISFIIFDSPSLSLAFERIGWLFKINELTTSQSLYLLRSSGPLVFIGILAASGLPKKYWQDLKINKKLRGALEAGSILILLLIVTAYLVDSAYNPFLYFRF